MTRFNSMMNRTNAVRSCVALAAVSVALSAGCNIFRDGDEAADAVVTTRPATTQQTWMSDQPLPQTLQPNNRPVVQGPLPLIYLVDNACTIRVTNAATGEEIVTFPSTAMQIVRVEPRGVMLANKPVIGATLAPGDYAIEIVPTIAAGTVHSQQTITRSMPAAATKPAAPAMTPTPAATPPPQ